MSSHSSSPTPQEGETHDGSSPSGIEALDSQSLRIPDNAVVTVTPNPCMDRTAAISTPLDRGGVNRITDVTDVPAGKGINVAMATYRADEPTVAIAPASAGDPFTSLVHKTGLSFVPTPADHSVRVNLTVTEPDGTTTKLNEPGNPLEPDHVDTLTRVISQVAQRASWIVLSGSLPPGLPTLWYADMVGAIRKSADGHDVKIAVDTSDKPLEELGARILKDPTVAPDLLKPNGFEIGQILGLDGKNIEHEASHGNLKPATEAAQLLVDHGVRYVLLTLGASGAVLATQQGTWYASPPPITPVSTVGAGDSSLAGFIIGTQRHGHSNGKSSATDSSVEKTALQYAVAYGSAATSLPGTTIPFPSQTQPESVTVMASAGATALKGVS